MYTVAVTVAIWCLIIAQLCSLDSSRNLQINYVIRFLFYLHLILHACKIFFRCDSFEILIFAIKQGPSKQKQYSISYQLVLSFCCSLRWVRPNRKRKGKKKEGSTVWPRAESLCWMADRKRANARVMPN